MRFNNSKLLMILLSFLLIISFKNILFSEHFSSNDRRNLQVPEELWNQILTNVGFEGKTLGYTFDEMDFFEFYGNEFRLKKVWDLFRDVQGVSSTGGEIGNYFLDNYQDLPSIVNHCHEMIQLEDETAFRNASFTSFESRAISEDDFVFETPRDKENWNTLPQKIRDFVVDIIEASVNSSDILKNAYNKSFIAQNLGVSEDDLDTIDRFDLYEFIAQPWRVTNPSAASFDSMYEVDFDMLSSGTSVFTTRVSNAIVDLQEWLTQNQIPDTELDNIKFSSPAGKICVLGTGNQEVSEEYFIIFDLGGDDSYKGSHAVPRSFSNPVGAIIDISGNDIYDDEEGIADFCTGLFGIGAIFDLEGNDDYKCGESGLASAWQGTGILVDYKGNDIYEASGAWSQGAAHAGVGLIMDTEGDDIYITMQQSVGFASTLGIGALLDVSGDDIYKAEGVWSDPFHNNTALCFGAGFGRRADYGDRRSLAGGIGIFVEGDGDDDYWGPVYVLGCGYWWASGFFEDRGGNDTYRYLQYSAGSAPHMATGCAVDLKGDDRYNSVDGYTVAQYLGSGRDGCIGVFIDGEGNDHYFTRFKGLGSSDLNSIGFFWDRMGDDIYSSMESTTLYGASIHFKPYGNMRDNIVTIGIFLDSNGHDIYNSDPWIDETNRPLCSDNKEWLHSEGPIFWGYGLDTDWYSTFETE